MHMISGDNPADCASHGTLPSELPNNDLWWNGPPWVDFSQSKWSKSTDSNLDAAMKEITDERCCLSLIC